MKSICWVGHGADLRLHDQVSLRQFAEQSESGFLVWTPSRSFQRADQWRRNFILASLAEFKSEIEKLGSKLIVSRKPLVEILPTLQAATRIDALFYSQESTPEEHAETELICRMTHLKLFSFDQGSLIHRKDLPFPAEAVPKVFTEYRKRVEAKLKIDDPLPAPTQLPAAPVLPEFDFLWDIEKDLVQARFHPQIESGEKAGLTRLEKYLWRLDRLKVYKETRDGLLDWNDSSKLSPWLSIGALSPRTVYSEIKRYERERVQNDSTYWLFFELLWRDYFRLIAEKLQSKLFGGRPTQDSDSAFEQWCAGETGDDFVDANMRELNQTGWMSNRGRQNVASYLAKTLGCDWRRGAEYFERKLIDYDCSSNWGNWAYLAGVGQDPRDRKFNTALQASRYDPAELYRKKWLKK